MKTVYGVVISYEYEGEDTLPTLYEDKVKAREMVLEQIEAHELHTHGKKFIEVEEDTWQLKSIMFYLRSYDLIESI